jgi:CTP synthase
MNYIFVVGGVMSSVGKGITVASIGKILQSKGYSVCMIKCDMYVNVDAGTIRPTEHGEVFVGEDGIEADQDLGNYERFTGVVSTRDNYITTGQIYKTVIEKERNLEYGGEDVEVVPDIPNEIIRRIKQASVKNNSEITIIEIGGTVGEYQNLLFLEAARMMHLESPGSVVFILVSYIPIPKTVGEMKTKPTQYAARSLNSAGIQADFILARAERLLDEKRKEKLSIFCNVPIENIISAPDVDSIYEVPLNFERENLASKILNKFNLAPKKTNLKEWIELVEKTKSIKRKVKIAVVGKYFATGDFVLSDSYISVIEAIKHACWANNINPDLTWINSQQFEDKPDNLSQYKGIIVPGGFGSRGIEGIIAAIKYVRENNIPFLGLCFGMQLAVVEFARNVCGLKDANSTEINKNTKNPVIDVLPEQKQVLENTNYGATMRLGSYPAILKENTKVYELYKNFDLIKNNQVSERHRHRHEVNPKYISVLEEEGLIFSGYHLRKDGTKLMEFMELPKHKFFVATQAHPEFKSNPLKPSPLFYGFVRGCL